MKKLTRFQQLLSAALILGLAGSNVTFAAGPATINLGSASNYVILAKTAITTTGVTSITGDIAISPAFSTDTSGFSLVLDGSGTFSTSALVTGRIYAANYSAPTPDTLTTAVSAMEAAYTDGATRTPGVGASNLNLGDGTLSGHNLVPGTYTWGSNVSITNDITFTGSASDVWILQISGNLSIEANKKIVLAGGALPQNIFWVVAGTTTLKSGSTFNGIILAGPGASTIAMQSGAILYGRALGQTDVTLIGNTITAVAPTTLHVIKTVINDNGGTAVASDFTLNVAGTNVSNPSFAGSASGVDVTLDAGSYAVTEPVVPTGYLQSGSGDCSGTIAAGETKTCTITNDDIAPQLIVNKIVINDNGRTNVIADFPLFIDGSSVTSGVASTTSIGLHTVSETSDSGYTSVIGGNCAADGTITLALGEVKTCTITNDDTTPTSGSGGGTYSPPVPPFIDLVTVPNPLVLSGGPGLVEYTYTLRNIGTVSVSNVTVVGDTCSPITLISGDTNADARLDVNETWVYTCSTNLSKTRTNTATATGYANGINAIDIANSTVIVGLSIVPPLIHVTKVPSSLTLSVGGGMVAYTYKVTNPGTVVISNVRLIDDKCSPVEYISGDINGDSKLDTTETWTYTCSANLTKTTVNTVTASGQVNGLVSRDFAVVTVVVADSGLSNKEIPAASLFGQQVRAIAVSLGKGSRGNSVTILQQFLISQGKGSAAQALAKVGATSYFGSLTRAALAEFQAKVGISPALGNFGPITRAYLKANY